MKKKTPRRVRPTPTPTREHRGRTTRTPKGLQSQSLLAQSRKKRAAKATGAQASRPRPVRKPSPAKAGIAEPQPAKPGGLPAQPAPLAPEEPVLKLKRPTARKKRAATAAEAQASQLRPARKTNPAKAAIAEPQPAKPGGLPAQPPPLAPEEPVLKLKRPTARKKRAAKATGAQASRPGSARKPSPAKAAIAEPQPAKLGGLPAQPAPLVPEELALKLKRPTARKKRAAKATEAQASEPRPARKPSPAKAAIAEPQPAKPGGLPAQPAPETMARERASEAELLTEPKPIENQSAVQGAEPKPEKVPTAGQTVQEAEKAGVSAAATGSKPPAVGPRASSASLSGASSFPARPTESRGAATAEEAGPMPELGLKAPGRERAVARSRDVKTQARPAAAVLPIHIPPILLEGDEPSATPGRPPRTRPPVAGPGQELPEPGGLPEAYGTGELSLRARDPHWLFAHWDLSREHQRRYNALSADGRLALRVYRDVAAGKPVEEVRVHPESQHWFVHVQTPGAQYVAQLGYYRPDGTWIEVSQSDPAVTPRGGPSPDTQVQFAQVAPAGAPAPTADATPAAAPPLPQVVESPALERHEQVAVNPVVPPSPEQKAQGQGSVPPIESALTAPQRIVPAEPVPAQVEKSGTTEAPLEAAPYFEEHPAEAPGPVPISNDRGLAPLTPSEEQQLFELVFGLIPTPESGLSPEQLAAARAGQPEPAGITSPSGVLPEAAQPGQLEAVSSPSAGPPQPSPGFWFQVNAELVIYGATEPTASVSVSGRPIRLRPDGSFSYRFSLPDGAYELEVQAESTHGDRRGARLRFWRATQPRGEVGVHPQDPALRPPLPESLP